MLLAGAAIWMARRLAPALPEPSVFTQPTVVLLPARNEEQHLAACLRSLQALEGVAEIRVVDDGSTDCTAAIAREFARNDSRIHLVAARELRPGWGGKVNALASGFEAPPPIEAPWILLTDADTRHSPQLLSRAQAAAQQYGLAAVSLAGFQATRTLGEALVTPAVFALLDALLGSWRLQARGEGRRAIANGQFFLVRREALVAIGDFDAIAGDLLDDVALAEVLRGVGLKVGFWRAGCELEVLMYTGFGEAFRGWRRNLALYLGRTPGLMGRLLLGLFLLLLLVLVGFLGGTNSGVLVGYGAGLFGSALLRSGRARHWAFAWPLELAVLFGLVVLAQLDRARGWTSWRGRRIPLRSEKRQSLVPAGRV